LNFYEPREILEVKFFISPRFSRFLVSLSIERAFYCRRKRDRLSIERLVNNLGLYRYFRAVSSADFHDPLNSDSSLAH
jgi:hypothetical protein